MTTATKERLTHINNYLNDYTTQSGVRVSSPVYIDLTTSQRKELLNAVRQVANNTVIQQTPASQSGITTVTQLGGLNRVEQFLGCSIEILRSSLFQRGGISADLVFKLQAATGIEFVSVKEVEAALKHRAGIIKEFVADNQYNV